MATKISYKVREYKPPFIYVLFLKVKQFFLLLPLFAFSADLDTEFSGMARVLVLTNLVGSSQIYTNLETGGLLRSNFNPTCPTMTKEAQEESILLLAATLNRQLCCQLIC